jgi:anthranilate phosphoribosyltransferase
MRQIMSGEVSPVMIAAILTGLRVKKETIGEITAAAQVMRELSTKVVSPTIALRRYRRHRRRRRAHLQHFDRGDVRRRRRRGQGRQARRAQRCRRSRAAPTCSKRWVSTSTSRRSRSASAWPNRHRLHVRAQSPFGHEKRRPGAPRNGRAHHLQHSRPADQPGRRAKFRLLGVFHPDLVGILVRVMERLGAAHVWCLWQGRHGRRSRSVQRPWLAN